MGDDWLETGWDLGPSAYPGLPRSFTNARTAKKRKAKELFVTEALLDRPVRLNGDGADGNKAVNKGAAGKQASGGDAAPAAAAAPAEQQQPGKAKKQKKRKVSDGSAAKGEKAGLDVPAGAPSWRQQLLQPAAGPAGGGGAQPAAAADTAAAAPKAKKSKNKFKQQAEGQQQQPPSSEQQQQPGGSKPGKKSKNKFKQGGAPAAAQQQPGPAPGGAPKQAPRGGLLDKMRAKLAGGHFRQLNEQLYTSPGEEAFNVMQDQPQLFEAYHEGFRSQVQGWPVRPVDLAAAWLAEQPAGWKVADFGCGDAELATLVQQEVASLDLVARAPGVIACNMAHTPLGTASQDAAVFSLALMGTDYGSFLREAARVVKPKGYLWLAEVRSRFADGAGGKEDFRPFVGCLKALGFKLVQQDAANKMFVVMLLRKRSDAPPQPPEGLKWPSLRPCVYKKR